MFIGNTVLAYSEHKLSQMSLGTGVGEFDLLRVVSSSPHLRLGRLSGHPQRPLYPIASVLALCPLASRRLSVIALGLRPNVSSPTDGICMTFIMVQRAGLLIAWVGLDAII